MNLFDERLMVKVQILAVSAIKYIWAYLLVCRYLLHANQPTNIRYFNIILKVVFRFIHTVNIISYININICKLSNSVIY